MTIRYRIDSLTSNTGDNAHVQSRGVTCIVGGNNSGKSRLLRDIITLGTSKHYSESVPAVLQRVQLAANNPDEPPTLDAITEWLEENAIRVKQGIDGRNAYYPRGGGQHVTPQELRDSFRTNSLQPNHLGFFLRLSTAGANSHLAGQQISTDGGVDVPFGGHPLGAVFSNGALESEFSDLCEKNFGFPLTFDRDSGDFRFRVGTPDAPPPPTRAPTGEYSEALRRLETLDSQGDGVRTFLGTALLIVTGAHQVHLIDEPETFLHPAQARSLGRWIATRAYEDDRQVIVTTHDKDFVLGLLDSSHPVTFIRLVRDGNESSFHQLKPAEVHEIWGDAVLRYSNVLQGLFHQNVIICESDADCRFFGAVLDGVAEDRGGRHLSDNVLFVPAGGKGRASTFATALQKLGVKTSVILDFDAVNNKRELTKVVEAIGEQWSESLNANYTTLMKILNSEGLLPITKKSGIRGVPREVNLEALELLRELADLGIHILPVGEMESFALDIRVEKSPWVSEMLEEKRHLTCQDAVNFVESVVARFR